jgi:rhodanese-related sulfurtransferase
MNRQVWISALAVTALSLWGQDAQGQLGGLLNRGPSVETISTSDLVAKFNQQRKAEQQARESQQAVKPADFVVVDVRSDAEIKVSIIPGAITKAQFEQNREKYRDRTVIPYCTIGGRSGAYARQLAKNGVKVKNYQGSILDWVKNELPVVTLEGKPTTRVHTYSDRYKIPAKYQQVTD